MRQTKSEILKKAGYVPHKGRPLKWNESTVQISFRLTESQAERLGANRHQSARSIILKYLSGEISDPPKMPPDCDSCPVSKAAKLGSKPHKKAKEIVERELGGS